MSRSKPSAPNVYEQRALLEAMRDSANKWAEQWQAHAPARHHERRVVDAFDGITIEAERALSQLDILERPVEGAK